MQPIITPLGRVRIVLFGEREGCNGRGPPVVFEIGVGRVTPQGVR
jgi:hypothetical protein